MYKIELKWLETILKENGYDVSEVLSCASEPAVSEGENYVSELKRLTMQVRSADGTEKQISIILKSKVETESENEKLKQVLEMAFHIEFQVYADILNKYVKYLPDKQKQWAECLALVPNKEIYFEDLKASDYKVSTRLTGLDNDHCVLVFESLAKLHAASYIAINNDEINTQPYSKYLMILGLRDALKIKSNSYNMMIDVIRKEWGSEWNGLAERLERVCRDLPARVELEGEIDPTRINVFNHGDLWVNNIMFKYDSHSKPTSLKFIDFQVFHYNSYGYDLAYFLNTSVDNELKKKYLNKWIEIYSSTFQHCLRENQSSLPFPSPDMVKEELIRLAPFSLNTALRLRPVIMVPSADSVPITEVWSDTGLQSRKRKLFQNPNYAKVMENDLQFLLDILEK